MIVIQWRQFVLFLIIFTNEAFIFPDSSTSADSCGPSLNISEVKIPTGMDINDFDSKVAGHQLTEVYHVLPSPPRYDPDIKYSANYSKVNDTYYVRNSMAETPSPPYKCTRGNVDMILVHGFNTAVFHYRDHGSLFQDHYVQVMWSACPGRYVWSMRCQNYFIGKSKCMVNESYFTLYVKGTLDDLPLPNIMNDFAIATGAVFGTNEFKWTYTYGENRLCT